MGLSETNGVRRKIATNTRTDTAAKFKIPTMPITMNVIKIVYNRNPINEIRKETKASSLISGLFCLI